MVQQEADMCNSLTNVLFLSGVCKRHAQARQAYTILFQEASKNTEVLESLCTSDKSTMTRNDI